MDLNTYQQKALTTAKYPGSGTPMGLSYTALKLNGEAGEFAEHMGKAMRDDGLMTTTQELTEDRERLMLKELGDTLWYIAAAAHELGYTLDDVANANLNKLSDRKDRGVLGGSGDER